MKGLCILLCFLLLLSGCAGLPREAQVPAEPEEAPEPVIPPTAESHAHTAPEDNILPHENMGYCGNTITTAASWDGSWEASFWSSPSVRLTDLLLYLDYQDECCDCVPEYTVDTEFGQGYAISLSQGFARYEGAQVDLTQAQIDEISESLNQIQGEEAADFILS